LCTHESHGPRVCGCSFHSGQPDVTRYLTAPRAFTHCGFHSGIIQFSNIN